MFRSFVRVWRESPKFRLGLSILLALVALALAHPLISTLFFGDANPLEIGADGPWLIPSPRRAARTRSPNVVGVWTVSGLLTTHAPRSETELTGVGVDHVRSASVDWRDCN